MAGSFDPALVAGLPVVERLRGGVEVGLVGDSGGR